MGDSEECNYLLKHDENFKRQYARMLLYVEWYEARRIRKGANDPPSRSSIDGIDSAKTGRKRSKNPAIYSAPCIIRDAPFTKGTINVLSDWNLISLTAFRELDIRSLKKFRPPPSSGDWITRRPVGMAKNVVVSFQGFLVETDLLVLDTGPYGKKKIAFGKPFLTTIGGEVDGRKGVITYFEAGKHVAKKIWHDPYDKIDGISINRTMTSYYKDLSHMGSEQGWNMGYREPDITRTKVNQVLASKIQFRDRFRYAEGVSNYLRNRLVTDFDLESLGFEVLRKEETQASIGKTSQDQTD